MMTTIDIAMITMMTTTTMDDYDVPLMLTISDIGRTQPHAQRNISRVTWARPAKHLQIAVALAAAKIMMQLAGMKKLAGALNILVRTVICRSLPPLFRASYRAVL